MSLYYVDIAHNNNRDMHSSVISWWYVMVWLIIFIDFGYLMNCKMKTSMYLMEFCYCEISTFYIIRHPTVEKRLTFCEIIQQLQKSGYHILKWTAEDIKKYNQEARSVGSPLECGQELYKDFLHS